MLSRPSPKYQWAEPHRFRDPRGGSRLVAIDRDKPRQQRGQGKHPGRGDPYPANQKLRARSAYRRGPNFVLGVAVRDSRDTNTPRDLANKRIGSRLRWAPPSSGARNAFFLNVSRRGGFLPLPTLQSGAGLPFERWRVEAP
jgi:hypothetical protein